MKRFVVRVALEFVAIATAAIVAAQLVKSGHPILGLWTLSLYGVFNLWRLGISKIDAEYNNSVKAARMRRLEEAFTAAAIKARWVSAVVETERLVTYIIDVPGHGRFLVDFPTTTKDTDDATKNDDAPAASEEG